MDLPEFVLKQRKRTRARIIVSKSKKSRRTRKKLSNPALAKESWKRGRKEGGPKYMRPNNQPFRPFKCFETTQSPSKRGTSQLKAIAADIANETLPVKEKLQSAKMVDRRKRPADSLFASHPPPPKKQAPKILKSEKISCLLCDNINLMLISKSISQFLAMSNLSNICFCDEVYYYYSESTQNPKPRWVPLLSKIRIR